jgi:hypothetical protein
MGLIVSDASMTRPFSCDTGEAVGSLVSFPDCISEVVGISPAAEEEGSFHSI